MKSELGLEIMWKGSTREATIFSRRSIFYVTIEGETEANKFQRTWIKPVNLNIQRPGEPVHHVVYLLHVRYLDIRWDLFPGVSGQAIVRFPEISPGNDSLIIEIGDPEKKNPMRVRFALPRTIPPNLVELWATHWNGTGWQSDEFRAHINQPVRLDMNLGVLSIRIQYLKDFYRIVLEGLPKDR